MIKRDLEDAILKSLKEFPVVGIVGPRQVGKTTLAKEIIKFLSRQSIYLDLELPSDLNKLREPELYLEQFTDKTIIVDEIQRMPELFPIIRALVDKKQENGRFLLLGSSSPLLIKNASETLAGRIIYHELQSFSVFETGLEKKEANRLWNRGGFPKSYLAGSDQQSFEWRQAFIKTYMERDIPQFGIRIPSVQLQRFWTMLAHVHGQIWNASTISSGLGVSAPTVKHYLNILEETFVVRRICPYYTNIGKRLIKSPKIYIRDTGIMHALLMIKNFDDLQGHPCIGHSWEGFVIEQIISHMPKYFQYFFYRTNAGAEIDLVLIKDGKIAIPIEIKYSLEPKIEKGFWNAYDDLGCKKGYVVYSGREMYPIKQNLFALPLTEISRIFE